VRAVARVHGGEARAAPRRSGGLTVTVRLPAGVAREPAAEVAAGGLAPGPRG
jgi:hypothetical protein